MLIEGRFDVAAPPAAVLVHLFDARLMASCLPGCESLEALGADRYRAVVTVAMAGVKARFDVTVEITARDADGIRAVTRGEEGGNASTLQATSEVRLAAEGSGTRVDYRSDVALSGRLGRFALGVMKKKAQSLGDEFAANLQARLAAAEAASPVGADDGASLLAAPQAAKVSPVSSPEPTGGSLVQRLLGWVRRLFGGERTSTAGRR